MKEKPTQNIEALKARIAELETENEKLKKTMTEAIKTLTAYVEKEDAIKSNMEKTTLAKDELIRLDLTQLRLIQKGVDNVKGNVKNLRSAGAAQCENGLTIGCLYHKKSMLKTCHMVNLQTRFWLREPPSLMV